MNALIGGRSARLQLWLPRLIAIGGGLAAATAQPPWSFLPGLFGYAAIFFAADRAGSVKEGFARGWQGGVGYFLLSLYWLAEPFQVDAANQGWMAPFAVALTAAFMALFWGTAAALYRVLRGSTPLRVLLFAASLSAFEWLRGHLLTGFPWDLPGASWAAGSPMSQAASVVGVYGLTWLTLVGACVLAVARERGGGRSLAVAAGLSLLAIYGWGWSRLAQSAPPPSGPFIRIVQADVRQESKYDPKVFGEIASKYVALTARPGARVADVVIWPEGAIPAAVDDYLAPGTWTREAIQGALQPGQLLILGAYRYGAQSRLFNSFIALRRTVTGLDGVGVYDKYRLVPFGEFMPLDSLASRLGVKAMVHVGEGFNSGPPPRPLAIPGLPLAQPLICYEALYSGFTRAGELATGKRPAWIVNISNDAWFGHGAGPLQHLNLASYRAIEEGLPMVRATPTGVSAVIDARGRIVDGERLGEGAFGVIDAALPGALPPTLFDTLGDGAFAAMLALSFVGVVRRSPRLRRQPAL